mmetsp:Transcript_15456/g.26588  ORF Transcript_15456/g.26588 Transcript_15456/m.26588 type:complete len:80 (-) Transcript_15456:207-446(-)
MARTIPSLQDETLSIKLSARHVFDCRKTAASSDPQRGQTPAASDSISELGDAEQGAGNLIRRHILSSTVSSKKRKKTLI